MKLKAVLSFCLIVLVVLLYWSGLQGDYVFDDVGNILENPAIRLKEFSFQGLGELWRSGDAGPLGRPVSILSFALNYYIQEGFDPFGFKLVNLIIHATNTVLVFYIGMSLVVLVSKLGSGFKKCVSGSTGVWLAFLAALWWGGHPLNLTSVLYVVQRMTSLSSMFGFLAVLLYVRVRMLGPERAILSRPGLYGVIGLLGLSALSKESGLLFVPLIALLEILLISPALGARALVGRLDTRSLSTLGLFLILVMWLLWGLDLYVNESAFNSRNFTFSQRVMTEWRVLMFYLVQVVFPRLSALSLYHDDFRISLGFFSPVTTALSLLFLVSVTTLSVFARKRVPEFAVAWLWFLMSHALESSFVPLELVHEHRNYFAIALFGWAALSVIARSSSPMVRKSGLAFILVLVLVNGAVTAQRSVIWSNLVDHAAFESEMHPDSDRANYQMGRIYLKLYSADNRVEYLDRAILFFRKSTGSYLAENGGYFGLIHAYSEKGEAVDREVVLALRDRLLKNNFAHSNIAFLDALATCQIRGVCKLAELDLIELVAASMENSRVPDKSKAELYKIIARYYFERLGDRDRAEQFLSEAVSKFKTADLYSMYSQVLEANGKRDLAEKYMSLARSIDKTGVVRRSEEK